MHPCEIGGPHDGDSKEDHHLGCDAMYQRYDGPYCLHIQNTAGIASQKKAILTVVDVRTSYLAQCTNPTAQIQGLVVLTI